MGQSSSKKITLFIRRVKCPSCSSIFYEINKEGSCPKGCSCRSLLISSSKVEISVKHILEAIFPVEIPIALIFEVSEVLNPVKSEDNEVKNFIYKFLSNSNMTDEYNNSLVKTLVNEQIYELENLFSLLEKYPDMDLNFK